jgi:hypothetical protein
MRIFLILLPAIYVGLVLFTGCGPATPDKEIAVAFYNCENLFDTIHDPGKDDVEFTPGGKYHYTQNVYEQKIHNIATVLQAMNEKSSVAIIGLAEVENNHVLRDLTRQPEIAGHSYKYEWFDGPDPRGINVAMLYDPKFFTVLRAGPLHIDLTGTSGKTLTRDVLYVYGILNGL